MRLLLLVVLVQALSHRTLVMLMGADPAKSQVELVSAAEPHVAFAYLKHLWHSDKKVSDFGSIQTNSNDLWRSSGKQVKIFIKCHSHLNINAWLATCSC